MRCTKSAFILIAMVALVGVSGPTDPAWGQSQATKPPEAADKDYPTESEPYYSPIGRPLEYGAAIDFLQSHTPLREITLSHLYAHHALSREKPKSSYLPQTIILYVEGEDNASGPFAALLRVDFDEMRSGVYSNRHWSMPWAATKRDGNNSCADAAAHYRWAINWLQSRDIDPSRLAPALVSRTEELEQRAQLEGDKPCVGKLFGGTMTPIIQHKAGRH